jgi:hypothetical protein
MATPNAIEKLATLSAQRTARTDRLHEAVLALLSLLENHVEVGASVTVDKYTLRRTRAQTNVGSVEGWWFGSRYGDDIYDAVSCDLDRSVDGAGYVHGDFNCSWRGPSRGDLILFASRAGQFVEALIAREEKIGAALSTAQTAVDCAIADVRE